jgi:hypothetical protein
LSAIVYSPARLFDETERLELPVIEVDPRGNSLGYNASVFVTLGTRKASCSLHRGRRSV